MTMRYYPVFLDIRDRNCLVVGGGGVGTRKAEALLDCGASVTVVSPKISRRLADLAAGNPLQLRKRAYRPSDLDGMFLAIGATDHEELNQRISREAADRNMLCNIADRPAACNFILPSVVQRGDLVIAISTSGNSPAFAKKLRQDMERQFGEEYAVFLQLMGAVRARLLQQEHAPEAHKPLFNRILQSDMLDMIRRKNTVAVDRILREILGPGYTFQTLMEPPDIY